MKNWKIHRLTQKQVRQLSSYREKWLAIANSCEPMDFSRAERAVKVCFQKAGLECPRQCVMSEGPEDSGRWVSRKTNWCDTIDDEPELRGILTETIVRWKLRARSRMSDEAYAHVHDDLLDPLQRSGGAAVFKPYAGPPAISEPCAVLEFDDICNLALLDYLASEVRLMDKSEIVALLELAKCGGRFIPLVRRSRTLSVCCSHDCEWDPGWWPPYESVVILQNRPCEFHFRARSFLHREGGPAVRFLDGYAIWVLNGVTVPQWLAETPCDQLDPRRISGIQNVEVRREFVRKVGIDRICHSENARSVDRSGDYELLTLDLGDGRQRPYLKMLNPSIGTWHVEGVHPECSTVAQALCWRNETEEAPAILT